jgi:6-phosphogluconolactonase
MSDELDPLDDLDVFDDDLDLTLYADQPELLQEVTTQVIEVVETGLRINGVFHLALTGGTLGSDLTRALVAHWNANPEMYQGLHIWWSDERFVERSSIEQNSAPTLNTVTNQNVVIHTLRASDEVSDIDVAVHDYLAQLGENFMDLTILGLGPDGHVASLFPSAAHIDRLEKVIAITDSPKPPAIRATFTMSMINTSTLIWIIAAGASKAEAVTKIIEGDLSIPASYVRATDHTRLIVDTDAFFTE